MKWTVEKFNEHADEIVAMKFDGYVYPVCSYEKQSDNTIDFSFEHEEGGSFILNSENLAERDIKVYKYQEIL